MSDATPKASPHSEGAERRVALRGLPSVHRIANALQHVDLPRPVVIAAIRRHLNDVRQRVESNPSLVVPAEAEVLAGVRAMVDSLCRSRIQPVINASGIIIHTNLGRSPLGDAAVSALAGAASNYTNLECDLAAGARGARASYVEHTLALLCSADAAMVVNNCAAALVLILRHFAANPPKTHVLISRGELVQIGGGFRVPEILEASGATLREVGTTNKTTVEDYRRAVDERTAMVLRVHRSNFFMDGFVESPDPRGLAALAREADVPFVEDLGSGATFDTTQLGGDEPEPTPADVLAAGADLVCFSGDKLLGGPQAGIIAGRPAHVAALERQPFFRALRCDKLVLAALQATVDTLLTDTPDELPIRAMMAIPIDELHARAHRLVAQLEALGIRAAVGTAVAQVGGGSLPRTELPSVSIDLASDDPQAYLARLRGASIPVIGHVGGRSVKLDLRTVFPRQDGQLLAAVIEASRTSG